MTSLQNWTLLPPLDLRDAGTAQVESFLSYVSRLAWVEGMSPGQMLSVVDEHIDGSSGHGKGKKTSVNGPSPVSLRRVAQVEAFTGQRLRQSTLWVLSEVLQLRGSGLTRIREKRWCPECVAEEHPYQAITDRLLWNFMHYDRCGIHGTGIRSSCRTCGSRQGYFQERSGRLCFKCRAPLGHAGEYMKANPVSLWVNATLEDFVTWLTSDEAYVIPQTNYQKYIDLMFRSGGFEPLRRSDPILHGDISKFRRRKSTVSTLLNLAALQGVSLQHLLVNPEQAASTPLFDRASDFEQVPFPLGSYEKSARRVLSIAEALLSRGFTVIPSFTSLAKLYGMSFRDVSRHDMDLCSRYADAHKECVALVGVRLSQLASSAARAGVLLLEHGEVERVDELTFRLMDSFNLDSSIAETVAQASMLIHDVTSEQP